MGGPPAIDGTTSMDRFFCVISELRSGWTADCFLLELVGNAGSGVARLVGNGALPSPRCPRSLICRYLAHPPCLCVMLVFSSVCHFPKS